MFCLLLPAEIDEIHIGKWIEIFVLGISFAVALLFVPFLKRNTDPAFWNFSMHTFFQLAFACVFAGIIFGGLSLAVFALHSLFDITIETEVYGNLAIVCFALFAPIYFLANIPTKEAKHSTEILYSKMHKILALYILTPILAIYMLILYGYLFKIIAVWELPNGWVSWLVSALALGGLLLIALLYPVQERENNSVVKFISRWFGLLIVPLLALMTIGICRRIGDYGITINRGYVLLANLWFYGIYIYLFFSQSRHIKWILISLVGVTFVSSMSVCGVAKITKISLTNEVAAVLNKQTSLEEAREKFANMPQAEKDRISSTLEYLYLTFGTESVQQFFSEQVPDTEWSFLSALGLHTTVIERMYDEEWISYEAPKKVWNIQEYTKFTRIDCRYLYSERHSDTIKITRDNRTFLLPICDIVREYVAADKSLRDTKEWTVQGKDYNMVIERFSASYYPSNDSVALNTVSGFIFYK